MLETKMEASEAEAQRYVENYAPEYWNINVEPLKELYGDCKIIPYHFMKHIIGSMNIFWESFGPFVKITHTT